MGSYLLRSGKDESLLVGDLHLTLKELTGLDQAAGLYLIINFFFLFFFLITTQGVNLY